MAHVKLTAVEALHNRQVRPVAEGLRVSTVRSVDSGDLLARLPGPAASAWIHQGDGLVGWGEAARLMIPAGVDRFAAGEKWLVELFDAATVRDEVGVPGTGAVSPGRPRLPHTVRYQSFP